MGLAKPLSMEEAARVRGKARDVVGDITPDRLGAVIDDRLASGSMIPGTLTVLTARLVDPHADQAEVDHRAAGVQLIYEGLRLTRSLVDQEPWADRPRTETIPADVDVLAADVLVARGFRLLARTEAADRAVATVQSFGTERTDVLAGRESSAHTLEESVFELAIVAGSTVDGGEPTKALRQYAVGLAAARDSPPLPAAGDGLPEEIETVLRRLDDEDPAPDRVPTRSPD